MDFLGTDIAPFGMGCWPIGGPFFRGDVPLGYANTTPEQSKHTIEAALDAGVQLFDTAAVYGAGVAERLMGDVIGNNPDVMIVSKIGHGFDEDTKQLTGDEVTPDTVMSAIERCLKRLKRDQIDCMLLHQNTLDVETASAFFEEVQKAMQMGKIRSFGWSTDFPDSLRALAPMEGFVAVEHAMNVFKPATLMRQAAEEMGVVSLVRSPLAMGVLTAGHDATTALPSEDHRAINQVLSDYFTDGRVTPKYLERKAAIREMLQTDGRSLTQGALCWLMALSPKTVPIPGARTPEQITETAAAIEFGPLPASVMAEIERILPRPDEGPATEA